MTDKEWEALTYDILREKQTLTDRVERLETLLGKLIPIIRNNLNYCNLDEIDELTELDIVLGWQEEVNNKGK